MRNAVRRFFKFFVFFVDFQLRLPFVQSLILIFLRKKRISHSKLNKNSELEIIHQFQLLFKKSFSFFLFLHIKKKFLSFLINYVYFHWLIFFFSTIFTNILRINFIFYLITHQFMSTIKAPPPQKSPFLSETSKRR
jgi:hypothetical protein